MPLVIENKKRLATFIIGVILIAVLLIGGAIFIYRTFIHPDTGNPNDYITLSEAAKMGEMATHKLMVQIESPKGSAEDVKGRYERGDIVLIKEAEHQFSIAEKTGFLIVRMELTPKQAELLTMSLDEVKGKDKETGEPQRETLKRRKFTVDLEKIGISADDQKGREIEDKVFKWEGNVLEKN
jgi:hypothetical protein